MEVALLAGLTLIGVAVPDGIVTSIGQAASKWLRFYDRFAARKFVPILALILLCCLVRLSILPWYPVPLPRVHDEFSLLLGAKTFALGRLTNPPHPLWIQMETFHVLQQPTYVSIYPPAQAAMLAVGILLGNPWLAILACAGLACGAFAWALRAWFSPGWALCGGILLFTKTILTYWSDSYWGGTLAALAAAIVAGAAGRIWFGREARWRHGWLLGIGIAILVNRRPLEGSLLVLGLAIMIGYWLLRKAQRPLRPTVLRIVLPGLAVLIPCAAFIGYYDMRATGNPLLMPYVKGIETYGIARHDILLPATPEPAYRNPEFREFYRIEYEYYLERRRHPFASLFEPLLRSWTLYLGPSLSLPLLLMARRIWSSRNIRPILYILIGCLAINCTETWILPHYIAPVLPLVWIVVVESLVLLVSLGSRWSRAVAIASIVSCLFGSTSLIFSRVLRNIHHDVAWPRSQVVDKIAGIPGKHLIFVKYLPGHHLDEEWVYNEPDIDSSAIVWVRDLGPELNAQSLQYFAGRRMWEAEVGDTLKRLTQINRPEVLEAHYP